MADDNDSVGAISTESYFDEAGQVEAQVRASMTTTAHTAASGEDVSAATANTTTSHRNVNYRILVCNKWSLTGLIVAVGLAVSVAFVWLGLEGAQESKAHRIEQHSTEIIFALQSAWNDYELFGLWMQESCIQPPQLFHDSPQHMHEALGFCSRQKFRNIYESMVGNNGNNNTDTDNRLHIQAAEFLPNISHDARPFVEAESQAYYRDNFPATVNYTGIRQFSDNGIVPSDPKPFYFPVHYVEPVETNEAAIELDLYSSAKRRKAIESALDTWKPVVSDRLKLVQDRQRAPDAYSILLFHPGNPTSLYDQSSNSNSRPHGVSLLVIRIPDLLQRFTNHAVIHKGDLIYVYDMLPREREEEPMFMGAARAIQVGNGNGNGKDNHNEDDDIELVDDLPEIPMKDLLSQYDSNQYHQRQVKVADRQWIITVIPGDHTQSHEVALVWLGGALIMFACLLVAAVWFRHQAKTDLHMTRTQNILSSMFPQNIQDRLMQGEKQKEDDRKHQQYYSYINTGSNNNKTTSSVDDYKSALLLTKDSDGDGSSRHYKAPPSTPPIADFFKECTVQFADIQGFTAWSSARDPSRVFVLLESIFFAFDRLCSSHNVFKVETVGDCYVCVTGVPTPRKDHAVAMVQFAWDCHEAFATITQQLQETLGSDTADLGLRVGIHSGSVISGVLRGEKPRLQLFGDTMNTASRIETSGEAGRIHASADTAKLLREAGKEDWLVERQDLIEAKGKGKLQTYWITNKPTKTAITTMTTMTSETAPSPF